MSPGADRITIPAREPIGLPAWIYRLDRWTPAMGAAGLFLIILIGAWGAR